MEQLNQIQRHTNRYLSEIQKVMQSLRPGDGLFGLGNDPKRAPCHVEFYQAVEQTVKETDVEVLSPAELNRLVSALLQLEAQHPGQLEMVSLMLQSVQGLALPLIPRLSQEDAGALYRWFETQYPRRKRMPNQIKVLKALKRAAS